MIYALILLIELIFETRDGDKHDGVSAIRLVAAIAVAQLVGMAYGNNYGALLYLGFRVAIFDYSIAILRGHKWDYLGNNFTDEIFKKFNKWVLLSIRAAILIVTIYYERI